MGDATDPPLVDRATCGRHDATTMRRAAITAEVYLSSSQPEITGAEEEPRRVCLGIILATASISFLPRESCQYPYRRIAE